MIAAARTNTFGREAVSVKAVLRSPVLALTLATLFWSGSFVVGRALRNDIDPVVLTFFRWLISLAILAPFAGHEVLRHLPVLRREWRLVVGLAATGIALFHPLVYVALQQTSATNALLTLSLSPVVILVGASLAHGRRPTSRELSGLAVSLVGAAVLITRGDVNVLVSRGINIGDLWMLAAVAVWSAYSLLLRRRPADLPQTVTLVASIVAALPMLLPFAMLTAWHTPMHLTTTVVLGTLYVAVFGSVLGFMFWSYGVADLGPTRAGQFVHLMPVFGAALSFVFLGEPLSFSQVLGAGFVLSGIALIEVRRARQS